MKKGLKIFTIMLSLVLMFFFGWFFSNNTIYKDILKSNNIEKSKYNELLKNESKIDIINYISDKVESDELVQIDVMNYLFENTYKNASEKEKYSIFYTYYNNIQNHVNTYETFLNNASYLEITKKSFSDAKKIDLLKVEEIDNYLLKTVLTEMSTNNFIIYSNPPYLQVYFEWEGFLKKFDKILDNDYKEFSELELKGSKMVINPNHNDIDMQGVIWYLVEYENYIKTTNNNYLKLSAEEIYIKNLFLFTGVSDNGLFYSSDYNVSESYINGFEFLLEKYPDTSISEVVQEVYDYILEVDGKEDVSMDVSNIVYDYLESLEWLTSN